MIKVKKLTELLKQNQYSPLKNEEQVVSIYVGVKGYLDLVDANDVTRFEEEFLRKIRTKHQDILDSIKNEGKITEETEEKLKQAITEFVNFFK